MSIRVPSSRGPKEQVEQPPSTARDISSTIMDLPSPKSKDNDTNILQSLNDQKLKGTHSASTSEGGKTSRQSMEIAVSSLAKAQQVEVHKLMEQQEKDRHELKKLFDQQQRRLIQVRRYNYRQE